MKKNKKTLPKERNPFVQQIRLKPSGPHGKSKKAKRLQTKQMVRKEIDER